MKPEIIIVVVPSVLSILGGMFTLLSFALFPNTRSSAQVLAVYLSFAGMCYAGLTFFYSEITDNAMLCSLTAAMASYFNNAAIFTTVVVATYMRRIFFGMSSKGGGGSMSLTWRVNILIWGLPAVLAALPFSTGHYGHNNKDIFCWIEGEKQGTDEAYHDTFSLLWQLVVVIFPVGFGICYNFWVYFTIVRSIRLWANSPDASHGDTESVMAVINRIRWYPIILAVVYVLPAVHRIYHMSTGHNTRLLSALGAGSLKMQGFLDSMAYGLTPSLVAEWKRWCSEISTKFVEKGGRSSSSRCVSDDRPILGMGLRHFRSEESSMRESSIIEEGGGDEL